MISKIKNIISLVSNKLFFEHIYRKKCFEENSKTAETIITTNNLPAGKNLYLNYIIDLKEYQFSFIEWYYLYKLHTIQGGDSKKTELISILESHKYYRKYIDNYHRHLFSNKSKFIEIFSQYIKRETLNFSDKQITCEEFMKRFQGKTMIVKPMFGSLGRGIFKASFEDIVNNEGIENFLNEAKDKHYLIEECIEASDEIQSFHSQSLNTIRVVTCIDRGIHRILGAVIRFGVGDSIIDNVHTGGLFCSINTETGCIDSNAFDSYGKEFETHPDSEKRFKGFPIPKWEEIKTQCLNAHKLVDTAIVGWDVCINKKGEVEFIEGNHAPDMDLLQVPHQNGLKEDFIRIVTRKQ